MEPRKIVELIAQEFYGWKWMRYLGMPTNDHPQYRTMDRETGIPVREFMPRLSEKALESWNSRGIAEADMTEPLSYRYRSSIGPAIPPDPLHCMQDLEHLERQLHRLDIVDPFETMLLRVKRNKEEHEHPWRPSPRMICVAAIAALRFSRGQGVDEELLKQ